MAITAIAALFLAAAASPPVDDHWVCGDKETQTDMNICASDEADKADRALNRAYAQLMTRFGDDSAGKSQLRAAQRAWIAFRDSECTLQARMSEGGTIHSMSVSLCLSGLTEQRTKELSEYLKCEEGDFSCPVW